MNINREESLDTYENRFIFTLLNNLRNFYEERVSAIGGTSYCLDKNNMIYMAHEPSKLPKTFTDNKKWNEVHLFGHIHEKQMIKRFGLNVWIDCHNFKPIDLDTVLFYDNALKNFYDEEVFM